MTTDEKRFFRREFINAYFHHCYHTYQFPVLHELKKQVREWELTYYNQNLNVYSKGE